MEEFYGVSRNVGKFRSEGDLGILLRIDVAGVACLLSFFQREIAFNPFCFITNK